MFDCFFSMMNLGLGLINSDRRMLLFFCRFRMAVEVATSSILIGNWHFCHLSRE